MQVIVNGVSALKPKTGVGHTTANLFRAMIGLGTADRFWLYPGETPSRLVQRTLRPPTGSRPDAAPTPGRGWLKAQLIDVAKAAYRAHFRAVARWGNFDLYHEPNFVPIRTHLPSVVTVHDLSVVHHPDWHPADRVEFHQRHFRQGLALARHVVVVSEHVRREVLAQFGLPSNRVTTIHNGIDDRFQPQPPAVIETVQRKLGLPPRYMLAVGTIEPRKNIRTLLRAFCDLPPDEQASCPLVLAGGWGWKSNLERELYESEARHRGAIHLGYVADSDLPALYSGAAALFYPSYYEGFGLPPLEMLACGGIVVASTAAAVREVVGGHALLLDPDDTDRWRNTMRCVIRTPDVLDRYRRGGIAHARRFTWTLAARRTHEVYRQVLGLAVPGSTDILGAAA